MDDRIIRRIGAALAALGALAAIGAAMHGVSNVAALVAVGVGIAFITITYDHPEEGDHTNE